MQRMFPEYSVFEHVAVVPWPNYDSQVDWINNSQTLENWLNQYVGAHWARWCWAQVEEQKASEACVAFRWDKHRTLFLLQWA